MPTNKSSNFFSSKSNIVGMVLAISVIVIHLVFGLGALWPLVALASYGAGVVLTPKTPKLSLNAAPAQEFTKASTLKELSSKQCNRLRAVHAPSRVIDESNVLHASLLQVLDNWDSLVDFPEHQVTVHTVISHYIPALIDSYLDVPDRKLDRAINNVVSSFQLLGTEVDSIYDAIVENNLGKLEDHGRILRMQFGELPNRNSDLAKE